MDGAGNGSQENKSKGNRIPQYINNGKSQIIYKYDILEAFSIDSVGNHQNHNSQKPVKYHPDTLKYLLYTWGCYKGLLWNFWQESMVQKI